VVAVPEHYGARFFGEREAAVYDDQLAGMFDPAVVTPAVRGVPIHGIDASEAMVARLRAKPGGEKIDVTIGDFSATRVEGSFSLVYLVFNTIFNLKTQDEQVACFQNAAAHLDPGGHFVVENSVPELQRLPPGQNINVIGVDASTLSFDVYDVVTQALTSHHFVLSEDGFGSYPVEGRYVWPSELDLMGRLAGLRLRDRWAGWRREPFTSLSLSHVSVYER
jgi:SAM-dependent methyltransferase